MKTYEPSAIRNVLLVGHGGTGKTTLAEALLFASGATTRMGSVEEGNTVTDFEPEETKKQISVSLALAPFEWKDAKVNLLDAPGYADFIGDVTGAIRAADAVLFVVSAVDGVEVQHEVVWELVAEAGLPRAIFINKIDRERASFERTLEGLVRAFGTQVAPLQFPIGEEHDFEGIADLLGHKAYRYPSGPQGAESDWPDDIAGKAEPHREKLAEAVAEADDSLLEQYLETGELSEEQIISGVRAGLKDARIAPVLVGSASKLMGVDRLANFIVNGFPSPADRPPVKVMTKEGEEEERASDPEGPLTAFVFKTISDPYVGRISLFRVLSGKLRPDITIWNATAGHEERIHQIFTMRGKDHENVGEVPAGDIAAVAKLAHTTTGDTLTMKGDDVTLPAVQWPEPLFAVAVEPKTQGDEDKLSTALARIGEEDPTIQIARRADINQTVMNGMGEAHIDVMVERMHRKFGVEVKTEPAKVPYKETIRAPAEALGRHVKQTGGHGQYAVAHLRVEPTGSGGGFEFVKEIVGGVIPSQFIPSVEKGVVAAMERGVLAGYPVVDVRVTVDDGKHHPVDSSDMAFQMAGSLAFREAAEKAGMVLLEPIVDVEVLVPETMTGDIMGDLNQKRGKVLGMDPTGTGKTNIRAQVPQAEMVRYSIDLRSITGGHGMYTMTFSHYEEVPAHITDRVVAELKAQQEEAHK
ncbi:MAG TPA: elongation factor G [Actinomycetota bacterium]